MIKIIKGDIFETPADIRINTVNCVGVMGAGVALAFKNKYPEMFRDYQKDCKAGKVKPGQLHIWKNLLGDWIINLPTKRHWREPSRYDDVEAGLKAFRDYLIEQTKEHKNLRITLPALGCGHGGLDWKRVLQMIQKHLSDLEAEIFVFEPSASRLAGQKIKNGEDEESLEKLQSMGVVVIEPGHEKYPEALRGKSAAIFYAKGNLNILDSAFLAVLPSGKPSEREVNAATGCVTAIAQPGVTFLVGYGPTIERPSIRIALQKGADVVLFLPDGIINFRIRQDLQDIWDENRIVVLTAAKPNQKWNPSLALRARDLQLTLAKTVLITDPAPDWLFRRLKKRNPSPEPTTFYVNYSTDDFSTKGFFRNLRAFPIGRSVDSGKPNVAPIIECLDILRAPVSIETDLPVTDTYVHEAQIQEISGQVHEAPAEQSFSEKQSQLDATPRYPKRLIEVDLPIKRISEHARNEKNLRKGHPWHLHIWWARRPWGACRAVELASLLPAPMDGNCPESFVLQAYDILSKCPFKPADKTRASVQKSLLKFVGEFSCWELGTNTIFLNVARKLINASYPDVNPVVFDSFSGYGAIPGEAARLGCDSIALELNPVALLCLKSLLEAVPKQGHDLIEKVHEGAEFIKKEARRRLSAFYPSRNDRDPIAWLWARTVTCEGPGCGATIPLISQTTIARGKRKAWIEITGHSQTKEIDIHIKQGGAIPEGLIKTAGGGHAVCPVCGFTTNKKYVKNQGKSGEMGNKLYGIALAIGHRQGKTYSDATDADQEAYRNAEKAWNKVIEKNKGLDINEPFVLTYGLHVPPHYGITTWGDLFSPRQKLGLNTIGEIIRDYRKILMQNGSTEEFARDVVTALALAVSNSVHYLTTMSTWLSEGMISAFIAGNAIAMRWDWAEANPLVPEYVGGLDYAFSQCLSALQSCLNLKNQSTSVMPADATDLPLPDDAADMYFTDPPYYDVVPYADLSDLCYVWLKRYIGNLHPEIFNEELTPKSNQIVVNPYAVEDGRGDQSPQYYQERMTVAFSEGRRVLKPEGIGAIVFAHKGTAAWEKLLASILDAGFIVTASWPIDTERASRMRANKSAALGSSIHLIIRPREKPDGSVRTDDIGEWRDVLAELPKRIHYWMPRLAKEGVVGADAIFACLGPALEIYSRYSSVEKASGEKVELKEYLEQVWAAVSREALKMIFEGADASGFEEDARLTAMWLWTLRTAAENGGKNGDDGKTKSIAGYDLEYDAARKISQGLGAHFENLGHLVKIKGSTATLLSAGARTRYLFGKDAGEAPKGRKKKKSKQKQFDFMGELKELEKESGDWAGDLSARAGSTVLDQLHQSMILFGTGRGEALKKLLVDDGIGMNPLYWRLAQALSALYPSGTDEKRWVDGVLARKKGLGF